ncbi:MAG TPA: hypothetical protein VI728_12000 [Syntrophales bacterium]|nr:MAG: hypothetical protein A2052_05610 [Deltaproteobacteria bacterium GWA2_54_12]HLE18993.1 hypothetical protein [Syntrophales bacterium]
MKKLLLLAGLLFVTGCASTGPISMGDNNYLISKRGSSFLVSTGALASEIIDEAHVFCGKLNKKVVPVSTHVIPAAAFQFPEAQFQFTCADK